MSERGRGEQDEKWRRRPPSLLWPLVLVGAGVVLLLSNLGYLSYASWNTLWRLWPLLLVALGIDVLLGRRSLVGTIVSGVLILLLIGVVVAVVFFAQKVPEFAYLSQSAEWQTEHVEHPLGSLERASVYIDWTSLPGYLSALEDSPNLIEGDVTYRGELIFDVEVRGDRADVELNSRFSGLGFGPFDFGNRVEESWDVRLSPDVSLDLTLDAGSGSCDLNLAGLQISDLFIDAGSGSVDLTLPAGSTFDTQVDGGSGSLTIVLPQGVGAWVELDSGSGSFRPDGRFRLVRGERRGDGVWETEDYGTAEHKIVLSIDQGSGSVRIR